MSEAAKSARRGRFITLEGGEGAGKSTQARLLAERLRMRGFECVTTREPGGSPGAERLREVLLSGAVAPLGSTAEALLFTAARIDHLDHTIRPALARGAFVVCDRFVDSTRAYQGALGNLDPQLIGALERVAVGSTRPDLTLILDLPPDVGMARAATRRADAAPDRFEREGTSFHEGLRRAFLEIAKQDPKRCVVIDATRSLGDIADQIWATVDSRLLDTANKGAA
jgi:dTMP kinase